MSKEVKGIIVSRLIVLISIIAVPIGNFLIFNLGNFDLWFSDDPNLTSWVLRVLCPLVFSVAWFFFLIIFANRLSQTLDEMDNTVGVVPLRLKFFFGVNALFIMFIFIFPLITPVVSALSFASMAWHITRAKKGSWDDDKVSFGTRFLMILFSLLPVFCAVCFVPIYIPLSVHLWQNVWLPLLEPIKTISYCLCTALAIGSLFIMFANAGVSEYEELYSDSDEKPSTTYVKVFEVGMFFFFLYLAGFFGGMRFDVIDLFYNMGFFIVLLVSIVNFFKGKSKDKSFRGHLFGYILAAVFMGSNLVIFSGFELAEVLQVLALVISAVCFIYIFFLTFFKMEESEF